MGDVYVELGVVFIGGWGYLTHSINLASECLLHIWWWPFCLQTGSTLWPKQFHCRLLKNMQLESCV